MSLVFNQEDLLRTVALLSYLRQHCDFMEPPNVVVPFNRVFTHELLSAVARGRA